MDAADRRLQEQRFHEAMLDIYDAAGKTTGYWAHYFRREVRAKGGLPVAKRLLRVKGTSEGFERLKKEHALHLSVEALVVRPEFCSLFDSQDLDTARERLRAFGYSPAELDSEKVPSSPGLDDLLKRVEGASDSDDRWVLRNDVVAHGPAAREAMRAWLAGEKLPVFALSVLEHLAPSDPAATSVIDSYATMGGREHRLAIAAIGRIRSR
jgi:hypothetical protein